MRTTLALLLPGLLCFFAIPPALPAQNTSTQTQNASSTVYLMNSSFAAGKIVHQVQLRGNATWYYGDSEDSGTASLVASADGSSKVDLQLGSSGPRTESQSGAGMAALCQWSGPDGISHSIDAENCWKPMVWFLPAISLQPSVVATNLGIVDLGTGAIGSSDGAYRHLRGQLILGELPNALWANAAGKSTQDLGLDPTTYLPTVLSYSVKPDSGANLSIAVEIRFSDYRSVNGVRVPFLIQRYVNGSLQLAITVASAQIN